MATEALSYQNKFSTTLNGGISATDTTIPLTSLPSANEGYLVIEPDSSTAWEVIYYTSKTGSAVVVPSVAAGRGVGGSTAASHNSGATVRMDTVAEMFKTLQDFSAMTGGHTAFNDNLFPFVVSGCVWTADSAGSTRAGSMSAGVIYLGGKRLTVAAVAGHLFTASKDTYVDLSDNGDGTASPNYAESSNNAASQALTAGRLRVAIVVTGAGSIAAAASINQGQETALLPIASSTPYALTDSIGNLICPRDPYRKILGYRQITSNVATTGGPSDVTGLSVTVIIPANRKVRVSGFFGNASNSSSNNAVVMGLADVTAGTQINQATSSTNASADNASCAPSIVYTPPSSGARTFKGTISRGVNAGTANTNSSSTIPSFIMVELV